MRSYDPTDPCDVAEATSLKAEPWMLETLDLNPSYTCWGPHEDYMIEKTGGWRSPMTAATWTDFGLKALDDYNEVVHFYFQIHREAADCTTCDRTGYNRLTKLIADSFYAHNITGYPRIGAKQMPAVLGGGWLTIDPNGWRAKITQDEVEALIERGRLWDFYREVGPDGWRDRDPCPIVTAEEVNAAEAKGHVHDAINRGILIETRAKRLGCWGMCEECGGDGYRYTAPAPVLQLVLWVLHPRKGASRGAEIERVERAQLPEVYAFLRAAARRNAERFVKIPGPA